jgi:hypothetical protein
MNPFWPSGASVSSGAREQMLVLVVRDMGRRLAPGRIVRYCSGSVGGFQWQTVLGWEIVMRGVPLLIAIRIDPDRSGSIRIDPDRTGSIRIGQD